MCTSLKWTTWKGVFPVEDQTFGDAGAGFPKETVYGVTAGCWQRPMSELQSRIADGPNAPALRRSCAIIGPCCSMVPSQTSGSSA